MVDEPSRQRGISEVLQHVAELAAIESYSSGSALGPWRIVSDALRATSWGETASGEGNYNAFKFSLNGTRCTAYYSNDTALGVTVPTGWLLELIRKAEEKVL